MSHDIFPETVDWCGKGKICFQREGQTDSHVRGRWDRGWILRQYLSHLHNIFPEAVDWSGNGEICFQREGQTDWM